MKKKFELGADPEFLFVKNGELLRASEVVLERDCGFGYDGAGGHATIGEIRPGQSSDIMEMVAKIESIFIQAERKLNVSKKADAIVAGHFKWEQPLGGHIHVSYPKIGEDAKIKDSLGRTFDYYLLDCLEDLIAPKMEREQRMRSNGGRYGQPYRRNPDTIRAKTDSHIEYRAPGSWLVSPEAAYAYFYVAKSIITMYDAGFGHEDIVPSRKLSGMRGRINSLKELAKRANNLNSGKDMGLGRDILIEVIEGDEIDWETDVRKNWLG